MYNVKKEDHYRLDDSLHPLGIGIRPNRRIIIEIEGGRNNWQRNLSWDEWERIVTWVEWRRRELEASSN